MAKKIMFEKTEVIANVTVVREMNKKSQKVLRLLPDKFSQISFVPCKEGFVKFAKDNGVLLVDETK